MESEKVPFSGVESIISFDLSEWIEGNFKANEYLTPCFVLLICPSNVFFEIDGLKIKKNCFHWQKIKDVVNHCFSWGPFGAPKF